jgi:hypothetical protein
MGLSVIFALVLIAIVLFLAVRRGWVNQETFNIAIGVAGIVGALAAAAVFIVPSPLPPASTDTSTTEAPSSPTFTQTTDIDTNLTVYDNFDNPTFDKRWDEELWEPAGDISKCNIVQEDGRLIISCTKPEGAGLGTPRNNMKFMDFSLVEAKLMLDREIQASDGHVHIQFETAVDDRTWLTQCGISGSSQSDTAGPFCVVGTYENQQFTAEHVITKSIPLDYNTWHTIKIEINSSNPVEFKYFIDGQLFGTHRPGEANILLLERATEFYISVKVHFAEGSRVTGYIDDVRIW